MSGSLIETPSSVTKEVFFYVVNDNYDEHAELAIPRYVEMHKDLARLTSARWDRNYPLRMLDLGAGTGKTTEIVLRRFPKGSAVAIDKFSEMLHHAQVRLGSLGQRIEYVADDFMDCDLGSDFDLCVSALAIHHQDPAGKRKAFKKVFDALSPGGAFFMIDWTKFDDPVMQEAAFEVAEEHVREKLNRHPDIMASWIDHWRNLNIPDTVEDLCAWMRDAGFAHVDCVSRYFGMALLYGAKGGH